MTESEWLVCEHPERMLYFLHRRAPAGALRRKARLFACATVRHALGKFTRPWQASAVEVGEESVTEEEEEGEGVVVDDSGVVVHDAVADEGGVVVGQPGGDSSSGSDSDSGLATLSWCGGPVPLVYLCLFLAGVSQAFAAPARWSLLPQVVPEEVLGNAVTWNSSGWQVASMFGAALAGILFAATGQAVAAYVLAGVFLWICVLKSGVHATLAGVALGFAVPLRGAREGQEAPLHRLEHSLHPWVAFGILPVFALANSGIPLAGISPASLLLPVPLGIALGLFVGKQLGASVATWLSVRLGLGTLPAGASWLQMYGVCVLAGVGFTMSLFIGTLAFADEGQLAAVRLGVLTGSLLSAVLGYIVLYVAGARFRAIGSAI